MFQNGNFFYHSVSAILLACGINKEIAARTVRFSVGRETTKRDVDVVINELKSVLCNNKDIQNCE